MSAAEWVTEDRSSSAVSACQFEPGRLCRCRALSSYGSALWHCDGDRGRDSGDALPAGWSAGPHPRSDAVAGGEAGPAGPMVDMVLVADDPVVPSAAQPQKVTVLLRQFSRATR